MSRNFAVAFFLLHSFAVLAGDPPPAAPVIRLDPVLIQSGARLVVPSPSRLEFGRAVCSPAPAPGPQEGKPAPPTSLLVGDDPAPSGWMRVVLAAGDGVCGAETVHLDLFPLRGEPWEVSRDALTLWFDAGIAEFAAPDPERFQLAAVLDERVATLAPCGDRPACTLLPGEAFLAAFAAPGERARFTVWPAAVPLQKDAPLPVIVSPGGRPVDPAATALAPREIHFERSVIAPARLDSSADRTDVPVRFPRAVDRVSCDNAECRLAAAGVLVFQIDPAAPAVRMRYTLKPRFLLRTGGRSVNTETVSFSLERCRIRIPADLPLLGGAENHRIFVRIPRECASADLQNLQVETRPPAQAYVRAELDSREPDVRLLELSIERVPARTERLEAIFFERSGVLRRLGSVRIPVSTAFAPSQVRLEVPAIGPIDFIPSNQDALLHLAFASAGMQARFALVDRPGFYTAIRDGEGWRIRGKAGAAGNVPLRIAYRPLEAGVFLDPSSQEAEPPTLVTFDTDATFPVRDINLPVPLLPVRDQNQKEFIEVLCDHPDGSQRIEIGQPARIPHEKRDSCRIVFRRDRLPATHGDQRLRVEAGDFKQVLTLTPGEGTLTISIPAGDRKEYDTITVVVAHDLLSGHYTLRAQQKLGEEARYRIVLSDSSIRIGATTALPTGMFRFGSGSTEGTVPISAGALARITYLQDNGRDFPVGLEFGLFGTNLSGQPDFSIVTGVGLSIPVLNPDTPLQASFNIHAWLELAPTRAARDEGVVAFLFGPSFTVGRVSTTF